MCRNGDNSLMKACLARGLPSFVWKNAAAVAFFMALPAGASGQIVLRDGWAVKSSAQVSATGEQISEPGFSTQGWYATALPQTVFAVLVENGVYKNPFYGMNL